MWQFAKCKNIWHTSDIAVQEKDLASEQSNTQVSEKKFFLIAPKKEENNFTSTVMMMVF